ncbi:rhamnogalacturonase [Colletotrichum sublineola]|uniref:Rhamnogalacturonate lyase n=1 Tax=Colletotrichum sublineola TaxID=1173701 RepID=A0A066XBV4_COLSU|nr:rhamnogalacturonase [Colletotrichum sublineola]KDN66648.1 putative rhamnogalacturonase B [Colletotrichum sublineola]
MASSTLLHFFFFSILSFASSALAAFGVTTSGSNFVIDAGSSNPLIFQVSKSSCDINSIKYRGHELQYTGKGSHISSGLGSATVEATTHNLNAGRVIKVTCTTSALTHYLIVKEGDSSIYMATYITAEPSIGELRWISRLNSDILPSEYPFGVASTTAGSSSAVEGSDVFVVNGQTRSKFYSSERFIDDKVRCVYGTSPEDIHVCVSVEPKTGFELSSGGPFFRDINTNNAGDSTNLYNYMNSGHVQTEPYRMGLHGPYVQSFSRSGIPKANEFNYAFLSELGLKGYVASSGRGTVSGTASGIAGNFQRVIHWYNANAQYWTYASSTGAFTSPLMKPGTYTMVLYQTEFKVATSSVSVTAGKTVTANIASGLTSRNSLWKIGEYDGQPTGFRNADKQLRMHPSDSRMSSWGPLTYTVGSSPSTDFPMAILTAVNNPVTIKFNLASAPGAATLRIATTLAFAGGRPQAKVNNWTGPAPAAPTKIDSRGITRGTYRGFGEVYDVSIPAGTLVAGANTITISVISGSSGTTYLSPSVIFDAVELFQ